MISKEQVFILLLILCTNIGFSQTKTREITYQKNKDKSITFYYSSYNPSSVLLILTFNQLTNTSSKIIKKNITGYGGEIVTLHPIDSKQSINFSYSYRILLGNIEAKPDFNFKYILPFKKGKKIKVRNLSYLGKKFGNTAPKNWKSFQFLTKPNDTVLAIRKGIVVSVSDGIKAGKIDQFSYKSKVNSIIIEHQDGTFARYSVLKEKSSLVNIGDTVYPSTPIAIGGSYDLDENSQLRLSIFYLDKKILNYDFSKRKNENLKNRTHLNSYVDPIFYTDEGQFSKLKRNTSYSATFNNSIIELEMNKREKRKWKKKGLLVKKK